MIIPTTINNFNLYHIRVSSLAVPNTMLQKRQQEDDREHDTMSEPTSSDDKRQKMLPSPLNGVLEAIRLPNVQHFMEPVLEPLIRRVVKEEIDLAFKKYLTSMKWNCGKEAHPYESRRLQLQFSNSISLPVFTGTRIEGDEGSPMTVSLIDSFNGQVVSNGPESLAKVEVVVLEGDFDSDEGNIWTHEEFKNNIVREREGKKPLLTGDAVLYLKEGIGLVGEISFTDNSSWTRSRKFRLGAQVVDNFDGVRIREAKTERFTVRDHRGELYKKHHPPVLKDEVWRLEKIGKDGAFHRRLTREKIYIVKDFLIMLSLDPARLRRILGPGMSAKMWEVTVEHARKCVLDKHLYLYCPHRSQPKSYVVFNIVGQLRGLLSEVHYIPFEKLSEKEKADAHNSVISAFGNWQEVVSVDDEAFRLNGFACLSNSFSPLNSPLTENSDIGNNLTSDKNMGFHYHELSASPPDVIPSISSLGNVDYLDALHGVDSTVINCDQRLDLSNCLANSSIFDMDSIRQTFCEDGHLHYFDTDCSFPNSRLDSEDDLQAVVSSFVLKGIVKAQRRWKMLFSVLRWFSIRRIVQRKPHARKG